DHKNELRGRYHRDRGPGQKTPQFAKQIPELWRFAPRQLEPGAQPCPATIDFRRMGPEFVDHSALDGQLLPAPRAGFKMLLHDRAVGSVELAGRIPGKQRLSLVVGLVVTRDRVG